MSGSSTATTIRIGPVRSPFEGIDTVAFLFFCLRYICIDAGSSLGSPAL
jgi:hypothetical protein